MNSIEAYEKDIEFQLNFIKSFKNQKPISHKLQKNILFTGSGDSLVSSMLAESFSKGIVKAMDPLDLYSNNELVKTKHVFFVSISGNTIANIKVAKMAKKSIAITSRPYSKLAQISNKIILLCAPNNDVFTAGSISFLESALTCISLITKMTIPKNNKLFLRAKSDASKVKISNRLFILGNLHTYPLAMYCAAKFYEVLGYDAHYCRIEQFSHMELFSSKKGDTVILFEKKNSHNKQLVKNLKTIGINVIQPEVPSGKISQVIYYTFLSQLLSLNEAKKKKKKDCHFITAKKIRNVSNQMIY